MGNCHILMQSTFYQVLEHNYNLIELIKFKTLYVSLIIVIFSITIVIRTSESQILLANRTTGGES